MIEDGAIDRLDAQQAIAVIVAVLSPVQAEVVLLRTLGDLSTAAIAKILGHDDSWVRVTYHRALSRLARRTPRPFMPRARAAVPSASTTRCRWLPRADQWQTRSPKRSRAARKTLRTSLVAT